MIIAHIQSLIMNDVYFANLVEILVTKDRRNSSTKLQSKAKMAKLETSHSQSPPLHSAAFYFFFFAFFLTTALAQNLPPPKFDGFPYGNRTYDFDTVLIEAFYDPVCPDSRDSWPPLKKALDYYGSRVRLVIHLLPLPWVNLLLSIALDSSVLIFVLNSEDRLDWKWLWTSLWLL